MITASEYDVALKLRNEIKFDSFEQLHQQIQRDAEQAKQLLGVN